MTIIKTTQHIMKRKTRPILTIVERALLMMLKEGEIEIRYVPTIDRYIAHSKSGGHEEA